MRRKPKTLQRICIAIATIGTIAFVLSQTAFAGAGDPVVFTDSALNAVLLSMPGVDANGDGVLSEGELAAMEGGLVLHDAGITDVSGMQYLTHISWINLSGNRVRDISPLAALPLESLDVSHNYLDLTAGSDDMAVITALQGAGCSVSYDPQSPIAVTGVSLGKDSVDICLGDVLNLGATVEPSDAVNPALTWASDNESVVTVVDGMVTAAAIGTANIMVTTSDGGFTATCTVNVKPDKLSTGIYALEDNYVLGVAGYTLRDILVTNFKNDRADIRVFDAAGAPCGDCRVGTGMKVRLYVGGVLRDERTVIISGDVDGTGDVSILDYTKMRWFILNLSSLEGAYVKAADANRDGKADILDYTAIRWDVLGLKKITSTLPDLPEVSDPRIRTFLDAVLAKQGKPYIWGDEGATGFDCSGLIYYGLTQAGYRIGRSTADTYSRRSDWLYVDKTELQPGDLMFYYSDTPDDGDHIGHIGIYLGNGYHIHASSTYGYVVICRVEGWYDEMLSHGRRVFV